MSDLSLVPSTDGVLDRWAASRDLWPGGTLDFWHGVAAPSPDRVFWPRTADEAVSVLQEASRRSIPVVPYGLGSGVCGGARGRDGAWVVDTKRMCRIGRIDEDRWTVSAEAGVNGQQLEDALNAAGFTLGHSPSSISCSSVGGWAAARSAGQFSSRYGVFEDMVLGLTVATPSGVLRVGVDGDDDPALMPLLLGSEGTLGVITSVTMRVWRAPETRWLRGYRFATVEDAVDAMRRLMQAELWPSVVRLYDPVDTRIGGRTRPKGSGASSRQRGFVRRWIAHVGGLDPVRRRSLALPLALPGFVNGLFDRLASGCLLIVGWEGRPPVVDALTAAARPILDARGEDLGAEPGERWFHSRHAVSYKLMPVFERGGFADTMEIAARWSELLPAYRAVRAAVADRAVVLAHMSHVYPEGGSIYFSFAGQGTRSAYESLWQAAQGAALEAGATVTHHHGVGSLKAPWASAEVGAAVEGWRAARRTLDPVGILNPGRLFVPVPPRDPGADPGLDPMDGLVRVPVGSTVSERRAAGEPFGLEPMFPWERLPAPPRWLRNPWQVGWTEVSGRVGAQGVRLGRGPRSAAGPDLRGWLVSRGSEGTPCRCTVPAVPVGPRWLGRGRCARPWHVGRELLRGDLRPAVLTVADGELVVGFRGPSAAALGALASRWVPGGLREDAWWEPDLPSGPLESCDLDDDRVVAVTLQGAVRRVR